MMIKHCFEVLNYFKAYKEDLSPKYHKQIFSLFFIVFGGPILNIIIRSFYFFVLGTPWGEPESQKSEILLFDLILIYECLIALIFALKLKENFLAFFLRFYPSVKVIVFFFSIVLFIFFRALISDQPFLGMYADYLIIAMCGLVYVFLFYRSAKLYL